MDLKAAATSIERLRNYQASPEDRQVRRRIESQHSPSAREGADAGVRRGARRRSQYRRSAGRRLRIYSRHQHRHGRRRISGRQSSPAPWHSWIASTRIFDVLKSSRDTPGRFVRCRNRRADRRAHRRQEISRFRPRRRDPHGPGRARRDPGRHQGRSSLETAIALPPLRTHEIRKQNRPLRATARKAGEFIPVTTPIYTASSYFYDSMRAARPRVRPRGGRPLLRALRQPHHERARRIGERTRKRPRGRRLLLRHDGAFIWLCWPRCSTGPSAWSPATCIYGATTTC